MKTTFNSEADVKVAVKEVVEEHGTRIYLHMYVPTGYGARGVHDFTGTAYGRSLTIETKCLKLRGEPSPSQIDFKDATVAAGGVSLLVDETNERLGSLPLVLNDIRDYGAPRMIYPCMIWPTKDDVTPRRRPTKFKVVR